MAATYTLLPDYPYLVETTGSSVRVVPLLPRYLKLAQDATRMANSKSSKKSSKYKQPKQGGKKKATKEKTPDPPSPLPPLTPSPPPLHVDPDPETAPPLPHNLPTIAPTAGDAPHAGPSHLPHPPQIPSNTPGNRGTAFNCAAEVDHTHDAYRPYLLEDLQHTEKIPVDEFYHTILGLPRDWEDKNRQVLRDIARKPDFLKKLKQYIHSMESVNSETNMYQPFLDLLHCVIDALVTEFSDLKKKNKLEMLRGAINDPAYIEGSDSYRKPDAILSTLRLIKMVLDGPQKSFFWAQLLAFVEFKLNDLRNMASKLVQSLEAALKSGEASSEILGAAAPEDNDAHSATSTSRPSMSRPAMTSLQLASLESPTKKSTRQPVSKAGSSAGSYSNHHFAVPAVPVRSTLSTSVALPTAADLPRTRSGLVHANVSAGSKRSHATMEGHISTDHAQTKKPKIDPASEKHPNRYVQCASYALELLTYGGWRSHVIGILVTDNIVEFLYYDHSIIVQSKRLDFCSNPFSFITGIYGLCRLTLEGWGLHPFIHRTLKCNPKQRTEDKEYNLKTEAKGRPSKELFTKLKVELQDGTQLELEDTIHLHHCIIGRGTCMIRVKPSVQSKSEWAKKWLECDDGSGELVMKLSWPAETRLNEAEIIQEVREKAVELKDDWVLDHLPEVLYTEDYDEESRKAKASKGKGKGKAVDHASTDLVKPRLLRLSDLFGDRYEGRVLRVIISSELSETIELTEVKDTHNVFYDVFRCYRWLYEKCGIIHRDLSHSNIMWRKRKMRIVGVLNDFDLISRVVSVELQEPTSKHRTGTKPFMAMELLSDNPPLHLYRHDLESLFYVMLWHTHRFAGGRQYENPELDEWATKSTKDVHNLKHALVHGNQDLSDPLPQHAQLRELLSNYLLALQDGLHALASYNRRRNMTLRANPAAAQTTNFNEETLGGHFSFDAIDNLFLTHAPHD
ncbi:hypothetical protein EIP91_011808 [Steccherinum ochraceum]|uniref:Protein kinase domain-containing protein n=1 Tax=Steccherinum ochraceum TaxID=92696 RepID=A0A4R0RY17_9APHY|nr:hypothetical protein EIP91_011808 [Steccherinum ochraceum]